MKPRRAAGYTLTEVMAGTTVVGVLALAAVPNISSFLRSQNSSNGIEQLGAHMRLARSRAVLEGNDYLVRFTSATTYVIVDDDGGGNGVPGAAGYDPANRNNGRADDGELVLGPYALPQGLQFAFVDGARNPFTGTDIVEAVTFPEIDGARAVQFHPNGTADMGGFVTVSTDPSLERHGRRARCRVLQVVSSTGGVETRAAAGAGN
jgi:prepilin-type N-terminal cleavage/methylation domain-containing protein